MLKVMGAHIFLQRIEISVGSLLSSFFVHFGNLTDKMKKYIWNLFNKDKTAWLFFNEGRNIKNSINEGKEIMIVHINIYV